MFGIGMPELLVIAVVALLVVGPKKLPDIAKALGKSLSEFRRATESATDTIKETLRTDDLKKDMNDIKDSLSHVDGEATEPPVPSSEQDDAGNEATKTTDDTSKT